MVLQARIVDLTALCMMRSAISACQRMCCDGLAMLTDAVPPGRLTAQLAQVHCASRVQRCHGM